MYIPTWLPKLSTLPRQFSLSFPVEIPGIIGEIFSEETRFYLNFDQSIAYQYRLVCRDYMGRMCGRRHRPFSRRPGTLARWRKRARRHWRRCFRKRKPVPNKLDKLFGMEILQNWVDEKRKKSRVSVILSFWRDWKCKAADWGPPGSLLSVGCVSRTRPLRFCSVTCSRKNSTLLGMNCSLLWSQTSGAHEWIISATIDKQVSHY